MWKLGQRPRNSLKWNTKYINGIFLAAYDSNENSLKLSLVYKDTKDNLSKLERIVGEVDVCVPPR